ncbi:MAG: adenylyl-sulfate kinase [Rickettsiales bacterium]|nr:adenylyl-sulfate kinase [Rickettsiales bacterium]
MTQAALVETPELATQREQMKIVIVGHVDHGKSSLIGRLFYETGSLEEGKYEAILASSEKRGMPFEWSFLLDALQAERDQGITIDTTQIWFKTQARDYVIIDAPGHKEFLKNMISGAASADAAILLIDAKEGVQEQSKRHGYLLHLLGIRQIAVAVNKMDLVDYSQARFEEIKTEYTAYLRSVGVEPTVFIPISAREGDNIADTSSAMAWDEKTTILHALDNFTPTKPLTGLPLRFPIQDVYKFDERRILAGRIESGSLKVGDEVLFSPSNKTSTITSLEQWPDDVENKPTTAQAGQSVGVTLQHPLFLERGEIISHVNDAPLLSNFFSANIVWLGDNPLQKGKRYKIKLGTAEFDAELRTIDRVLSTDDLSFGAAEEIPRHGVGEVTFRLRGMAALDDHTNNARAGRFVIVEGYDVVGGGIITLDGINDQRVAQTERKSQNITKVEHQVTLDQRSMMNGHLPGILWFTGLSGSGKSTLAQTLQEELFAKGYQVMVLDGDNIRHGLNRDLGFSADDRSENIRRVGEVAALFAKAGFIVITAFISPYIEDRRRARNAAPEHFHTVYIEADIETCEGRDVKGLYAKARAGEIKNFTGIDDPFEPPEHFDIALKTADLSVEESTEKLMHYVEENFVSPLNKPRHGDGGGI